jgi:lauroyl/myristoyl acyltransferase
MTKANSRNTGLIQRITDKALPPLAWLFCRTLGLLTYLLTKRREIATRNIALAFPERSARWQRKIAFRSVLRMFELFTIPLVNPWLSEKEQRKRYVVDADEVRKLRELDQSGGSVLQPPHCAMTESLAMVPMLVPGFHVSTMYRPLDFGPAERYVLWARSRWGSSMISRKSNPLEIKHRLSAGDNIVILFDQNAGRIGSLILSFGRICSATDLPGLLASHVHARTCLVLAKRSGFLRAQIRTYEIEHDGTTADITVRTTLVLEELLRKDEELCADWMWAHRRWKSTLCGASHSLTNRHKKNYLANSLKAMGLTELPRRQPYCLRMPDQRAKAELVAAWLPALREQRKDVRWIVVAPEASADLFREGENCERLVRFKPGGLKAALKSAASEWTEMFMSFEPNACSRREARLCRAEWSAGISTLGRKGGGEHLLLDAPLAGDTEKFAEALKDYFRMCGMEISA